MTGLVASNFAYSSLAGSISNTATSLALTSGSGALFPQLTGVQYFMGVLSDAATGLQREIVKVVGITGDTITVVRGQEGTTALNWTAGDKFNNLFTAGSLAVLNQFTYVSWDRSSPPATDVYLAAGDQATISFESVTTVPLTIQTVPGFYRVLLTVSASNSVNSDLYLFPNNTTYASAFSRYSIEAADQEIASFGSNTGDPVLVPITGTVPGFSGLIPLNAVQYQALNAFLLDLFYGPDSGGYDTINDRGPFIVEILINTFTGAKIIKSTGAITGGASVASGIWVDTVTAWTSLGTLELWLGTGLPPDQGGPTATITGVAVVQRLA